MTRVRQGMILLSAREEWDAALAGIEHAFAHTWASCHAMHLTTGWPTYLYHYDDGLERFVCPFSEREFRGTVDVVTPYGFSGFAGTGEGGELLDHWRAFARERGYVCGYVGLNPVLAPPACAASPDYVEYNDLYVLRLDLPRDDLEARLSENRRRQLRRFTAGVPRLVEDRDRLADFFLAHVAGFLAEKGAGAAYAFSRDTLRALLDLDEVLIVGGGRGSEVEAVCVFARSPFMAEYLFGVSLPGGRSHSAALLWEGAMRLRDLGVPRLNLGGGIRRGDGVADFKKRFGAERWALGCLKQVYLPEAYAALCREVGADPHDRSGYFPAFRGGAARSAALEPA